MPPSPLPFVRRALAVAIATGANVTSLAVPAGAHVTITPDVAKKGSFSVFSFSVPNESETASTTAIEVTFPVDDPIPFVSVQPIPGWTWSAERTVLAKAVKTDDGPITDAVSKLTWSGGAIAPGEFQLFTISAGPLPTKTKSLTFKVVQTYSDGTVSRWIEDTPKGGPEPEFPAPVLRLAGKSSGH